MQSSQNYFLCSADVPKGLTGNLLYRAWLWQECAKDPAYAAYIEECCRRDVVFYCDSFVMTKSETSEFQHQPFILYQFQEEAIRLVARNAFESQKPENFYRRWDALIEKSRELGASWLMVVLVDWIWRFYPNKTMMVFSRTEEDVDKTGRKNTIFDKFDYIEARLPAFLQVRGVTSSGRSVLQITNPKNGSAIQGYASNPDAGSGGRAFLVWADEFAKVENGAAMAAAQQPLSRCRVYVSTHKGAETEFARMRNHAAANPGCGIDVISMHWSQHPLKAAGLYSVQGGVVTVLDQSWHDSHPGYKFSVNTTSADPGSAWEHLRSPWFDGEDRSQQNKSIIAQELQISQLIGGQAFFDPIMLSNVAARNVRAPDWQGNITQIMPALAAIPDGDGRPNRCKVWWQFNSFCVPQVGTYSIGADIATGNGTSDSVLTVGQDDTGEEVLQWRSNRITPEDFGRLVYAVAGYFSTPYAAPHLGWDASGPGGPFGTIVTRLLAEDEERGIDRLPTIYFHVPENRVGAVPSKTPGVPAGGGMKVPLMTSYADALANGKFITRDESVYLQAQQFVWMGDSVEHTVQKGDRGKQHGDVVMAQVVLWKTMQKRPEPEERQEEPEPQERGFQGRLRRHLEELEAAKALAAGGFSCLR